MIPQTSRLIGGLGLAWALALSACGGGDADSPAAPSAATSAEVPAAEPAPDAAPAPARPADAARGAKSYAQLCATCHGAQGDADTPMADLLDPRPARHSDGNYMNALDDDYLFQVIKFGGAAVGKSPQMTAWGTALGDDQIRDIIAFLRTLADPPYTTPAD